ncbi:MAG TPA: cobyric acid synthase [Aquabacterium sp.]|uniref:cobyric acid synthase n=1 Tax=Aquabacterium sp. TaxID=1872578 RepID=UPI002E3557D8|nr:cobyric acid synthase [Aquabacterium sp.]HEX5356942.1 cobyric acid synthase [Aquabacterium sp.]
MTHARAVMVLGTSSGAGKSWLATALCRWYARQGLKVAPFKAQNMSNNARVVPGPGSGLGEIGSAQYFQAQAARATPDVRMNPVLLKPEHDTASQVVVMGQVRRDYSTMPWRSRSELLWPHAQEALASLMSEHDVVVIEGAGSPAEINLHDNDFVNMRTALAANAACLLVTDIDRGGAFAHLYGTHQLLPQAERALIRGFVLNRFRGDAALLAPGPDQLQALTGVPTMAVIPMQRGHGLPEEDGLYEDAGGLGSATSGTATRRIAIVAYPRISNLDELQPLRNLPDVKLVWARQPRDLDGADWIILPGSKHTRADLQWLHDQGLAAVIQAHAAQGRPVLGICGGLQMLGDEVQDLDGIEGAGVTSPTPTSVAGLKLLPLHTRFDASKALRSTRAIWRTSREPGRFGDHKVWSALHGHVIDGYEIHHGRTSWADTARAPDAILVDDAGQAMGWQRGAVLGVYLHGLFESSAVMQALFGQQARTLDGVFDGLADVLDQTFAPGSLMQLLQP